MKKEDLGKGCRELHHRKDEHPYWGHFRRFTLFSCRCCLIQWKVPEKQYWLYCHICQNFITLNSSLYPGFKWDMALWNELMTARQAGIIRTLARQRNSEGWFYYCRLPKMSLHFGEVFGQEERSPNSTWQRLRTTLTVATLTNHHHCQLQS